VVGVAVLDIQLDVVGEFQKRSRLCLEGEIIQCNAKAQRAQMACA
jgi:hypothetical protein